MILAAAGSPLVVLRTARTRPSKASDHVWDMLRRERAYGVDAQGLTVDSYRATEALFAHSEASRV